MPAIFSETWQVSHYDVTLPSIPFVKQNVEKREFLFSVVVLATLFNMPDDININFPDLGFLSFRFHSARTQFTRFYAGVVSLE